MQLRKSCNFKNIFHYQVQTDFTYQMANVEVWSLKQYIFLINSMTLEGTETMLLPCLKFASNIKNDCLQRLFNSQIRNSHSKIYLLHVIIYHVLLIISFKWKEHQTVHFVHVSPNKINWRSHTLLKQFSSSFYQPGFLNHPNSYKSVIKMTCPRVSNI